MECEMNDPIQQLETHCPLCGHHYKTQAKPSPCHGNSSPVLVQRLDRWNVRTLDPIYLANPRQSSKTWRSYLQIPPPFDGHFSPSTSS